MQAAAEAGAELKLPMTSVTPGWLVGVYKAGRVKVTGLNRREGNFNWKRGKQSSFTGVVVGATQTRGVERNKGRVNGGSGD